jgi:hypothetical protein
MDIPTAQQVADALGRGDDTELVALASVHLPIITGFIREYTRGEGFTDDVPTDSIAGVIVTATARYVQNPELVVSETIGDHSERRTVFEGLSLIEQQVLNNYRKRAA